jgi:phasin family protein
MANPNNAQQAKKNFSSSDSWQAWTNWPQDWSNFASWADFGKNAQSSMDFGKVRQSTSENAKTATAANQVALEGLHAITQRTAEVMQKNARQGMECLRDACASKSPEEAQGRHSDFVSSMIQNCCDNARESTQISAKAAVEILDLWNRRVNELMKEWNNK